MPLLIRSRYPLVLAAERVLGLLLELVELAVHAGRILDHVLEQCAPVLAERARWRLEMSEKVYDVPAAWRQRAYIDDAKYREMYARSVDDPITPSASSPWRC